MIEPHIIYRYLSGISFPVTKQELINQAKKNNASNDFIDFLEGLPDDKFCNIADIWPDIEL